MQEARYVRTYIPTTLRARLRERRCGRRAQEKTTQEGKKTAGKRRGEAMQGIQHKGIRMFKTPEENTMVAPRPTIEGRA